MSKYVLILVDVMARFPAARDPLTLRNIRRAVKKAKKDRCPIVVLEMPDEQTLSMVRIGAQMAGKPYPAPRTDVPMSRSQPSVMKLLEGYEHLCAVRHKYDGDGSLVAIYACQDRGWSLDSFRVVGVNTGGCVLDTVVGLRTLRLKARIEVVQEACNTSNTDNPDECWELFPEDVILIPPKRSKKKVRSFQGQISPQEEDMTDILQNLISRFGESTAIVSPAADFRPAWLETFTREKRSFLRQREGIAEPFPDTDADYQDECLESVEFDVRVYRPEGHSTRIVLTEDYAQKLDEVRNVHLAAQYSGESLIEWSDSPLRHRARPEDFAEHLDELPDSSYIKEIYLLDWDNAFDPWLIFKGGCKSLAAATKHGNVEFYRAEQNGWLGLNVKHEWIHLAYARFRQLVAAWTNACNSEWYEWLPDQNALKSVEEHCALLARC